jgi:hypothetical protein
MYYIGKWILYLNPKRRTKCCNTFYFIFFVWGFQDDISGNWWLQFNDEFVGYWPRSLFHSLKDTADAIDWGGEVIVHSGNSPHMHTNMGSGEASYLGYKKAAYQCNLQYVGTDNALHIATGLEVCLFCNLSRKTSFSSEILYTSMI